MEQIEGSDSPKLEKDNNNIPSQKANDSEILSIGIKVVDQMGLDVYFKLKVDTSMNRLMDAYCGKRGISVSSVRFLYDGQRITGKDTPLSLEMENNDIIDAVAQQTGG